VKVATTEPRGMFFKEEDRCMHDGSTLAMVSPVSNSINFIKFLVS
jgi:hypothetical protein